MNGVERVLIAYKKNVKFFSYTGMSAKFKKKI